MSKKNGQPIKKLVVSGTNARKRLLRASEVFSRPVSATLGAAGRNVIIEKLYGSPTITKDGVTVCREIELRNPFMNLTARLIKEAALNLVRSCGDGTTTTVVLTSAIIREGVKLIEAGFDAVAIKRGLDRALPLVINAINKVAQAVDEALLELVCVSAANHDQEVGRMVSGAIQAAGTDGVIIVKESQSVESRIELVDGIHYEKPEGGWFSPSFAGSSSPNDFVFEARCVLDECFILIHEGRLGSVGELLPIMSKVKDTGHPLLVLCQEPSEEVLQLFVVNNLNKNLRCCIAHVPSWGERGREMLVDIAAATAGFALTEDLGSDCRNLILEDLGMCRQAVIRENSVTISEGAGNLSDLEGRIQVVRNLIATTQSVKDREKLEQRLGALIGGVCKIEVGAATETALKEKKARVDDALHAGLSALREGVTAGGGAAYLNARRSLEAVCLSDPDNVGFMLLHKAMAEPARVIAENGGFKGDIVVEKVVEWFERDERPITFDVTSGWLVDPYGAGIIDAVQVVRSALETAVSIAGLLLTSEVFIVSKPKKRRRKAQLPERLKRTIKAAPYEPKRAYSK